MNLYENCDIVLTTKHNKEQSIGPAFAKELIARIVTCELDTDTLGTFSGEIPRILTAVETAKRKCEWGLATSNASFGLASEGSFGPHPIMHFLPCNQEILYFIDKKLDLYIYETSTSLKTNYQTKVIKSLDELMQFASNAQYPSHGLIIRPNITTMNSQIYKGIISDQALIDAFERSIHASADNQAWIETDMRAHMNPSRMSVIFDLSVKLAKRLKTLCEHCNNPGWGLTRIEKGLECEDCGLGTEMVKYEIFSCAKCQTEEKVMRKDGVIKANPSNCYNCNP